MCPDRNPLIKVRVVDEARASQWGWAHKFTTGLWRGRRVRVRHTGEMIGRRREETTFLGDDRNNETLDCTSEAEEGIGETGFAKAIRKDGVPEDGTQNEEPEIVDGSIDTDGQDSDAHDYD